MVSKPLRAIRCRSRSRVEREVLSSSKKEEKRLIKSHRCLQADKDVLVSSFPGVREQEKSQQLRTREQPPDDRWEQDDANGGRDDRPKASAAGTSGSVRDSQIYSSIKGGNPMGRSRNKSKRKGRGFLRCGEVDMVNDSVTTYEARGVLGQEFQERSDVDTPSMPSMTADGTSTIDTRDDVAATTRGNNPAQSQVNSLSRFGVPWISDHFSKDNSAPGVVGNIINGCLTENSIRETENAQVVYDDFVDDPVSGMDVRTFDYVPMPEGQNDVVIRVKASTVSYKDCVIRGGMWSDTIDLPNTPGFDCIGVVENIGDNVNSMRRRGSASNCGSSSADLCGDKSVVSKQPLSVGDPVAAILRTGGNARYVTVGASQVFKVPGDIDSAQAAVVLSSYVTAYQVLHRVRPQNKLDTLEGKSVLVTGGIGPVGMATIELAMRAGAKAVYATSEKRHHATLTARYSGVIPLPFVPSDWLPMVKGKMDCVVDGLCQDGYNSPRRALNEGGTLITIGANSVLSRDGPGLFGTPLSAMWASAKAGYLMQQTKTYECYESFLSNPDHFRHDVQYLFKLLSRGKIQPTIAHRINLDSVPKMHSKMENGEINGGVVVVKPWLKNSSDDEHA